MIPKSCNCWKNFISLQWIDNSKKCKTDSDWSFPEITCRSSLHQIEILTLYFNCLYRWTLIPIILRNFLWLFFTVVCQCICISTCMPNVTSLHTILKIDKKNCTKNASTKKYQEQKSSHSGFSMASSFFNFFS